MIGLLRASHPLSLSRIPTDATPGFEGGRRRGHEALAAGAPALAELQERLFAEATAGGRSRVLLVLQGMDTAGKGGVVSHVIGSVDPQGVQWHAFGAPTRNERRHDFLWRVRRRLPEAGRIGVFDRSHYEDVLIQRVRRMAPPEEIERRYGAIVDFERETHEAGTAVVKVMLHVGPDEQRRRLAARLKHPEKRWKFNPGDLDERALWTGYQRAYEIAIDRTDTDVAPWFVVPADHKWYARLAVQELLTAALRDLGPEWPKPGYDLDEQRRRLKHA